MAWGQTVAQECAHPVEFFYMQFQSWTFLLFFIPVLLLYWAVRGTRLRIPVLLAASYVFYASFNVYFLICLGVVTIVDYLVALQLSRHRSRWLVCVSLLVDLGMLCSFKYIPRVTDFGNTKVINACGHYAFTI